MEEATTGYRWSARSVGVIAQHSAELLEDSIEGTRAHQQSSLSEGATKGLHLDLKSLSSCRFFAGLLGEISSLSRTA